MAGLQLIGGLVLLGFAAEWLVKGAVRLAAVLGIPSLVIGLTVVAFGTSAPELAVCVIAAFKGQSDLAVGNVLGSNIFNILVIIGLSALIRPLSVHLKIVRMEVPILIAFSLITFYLAKEGNLSPLNGALLFCLLLVYLIFQWRAAKQASKPEFVQEVEEMMDEGSVSSKSIRTLSVCAGLILAGLTGLIFGSDWFVSGASEVARYFGLSELVIGLTIVAMGTSLPEVATSIMAARKSESDIAIGNVIGSNIFNLGAVLGITAMVFPSGIAISQNAILFDFPIMIGVAILCLPVLFSGFVVTRLEGVLFVFLYAMYTAYLILDALGSPLKNGFEKLNLGFILPAIAALFVYSFWRNVRRKKIA